MKQLKEELLRISKEIVEGRAKSLNATLASSREALNSETKSSAGDKHETGRAMVQLEIEKASQQLAGIRKMKLILNKLSLESSPLVKLGSLVYTSQANYFLSVAGGEVEIKDEKFYLISVHSPIGRILLGKKAGDTVNFKNVIQLKKIV